MLNSFFKLRKLGTNVRTEFLAGLTTFSSMVYVLFVNPMILSQAGMDFGSVMTASIIITILATLTIGFLTNLPYAIAPAMGAAVFIVYSVVLNSGPSWQVALAALFVASVTLLILNFFNIRVWILETLPKSLLCATISGIGLFLIFIGLKEVGIIQHLPGGIISLGTIHPIEATLTLFGIIAIGIMIHFNIQAAFIITILSLWGISLITGTASFDGIVSLPPPLSPTLFKLDFSHFREWQFWRISFSIFLVILFDSSASLLALNKMVGRPISKECKKKMLYPDALFSSLGSFIGAGPLAIHLESATGIHAGGRTGLTSLFTALLFCLSYFFYPLLKSIPSFASAPIIMVIGILMLQELKQIEWKRLEKLVPALIVLFIMPLTFSIYLGFAFGFISYTVMHLVLGKYKQINLLTWCLSILFSLQLFLT